MHRKALISFKNSHYTDSAWVIPPDGPLQGLVPKSSPMWPPVLSPHWDVPVQSVHKLSAHRDLFPSVPASWIVSCSPDSSLKVSIVLTFSHLKCLIYLMLCIYLSCQCSSKRLKLAASFSLLIISHICRQGSESELWSSSPLPHFGEMYLNAVSFLYSLPHSLAMEQTQSPWL